MHEREPNGVIIEFRVLLVHINLHKSECCVEQCIINLFIYYFNGDYCDSMKQK